jgi:conjugative relaxase-like TrwC/TraI family protein
MRTSTPYYDMTFSAEKSVSLMYAGLLAAAKRAQDEGDERAAERFRAEAKRVEAAVMAGADRMLEVAEQRGAIVRTGHHSATSGEFRDAAGFVAVKFLQYTSRADDPQLHVQTTVLNKAQRADGADGKWRALDGRQLMTSAPKLGFAAHAGAAEAQALARLGLPLVKREDGNGFEVGGVDADTIAAYSSRAAQIEEQLASCCWSTGRFTGGPRTGPRCTSCGSGSRSRRGRPSRSRSGPERKPRRAGSGPLRRPSPRGSARPRTPACKRWTRFTKRPRPTPWSTPKRCPGSSRASRSGTGSSARRSPRCSGRTPPGGEDSSSGSWPLRNNGTVSGVTWSSCRSQV